MNTLDELKCFGDRLERIGIRVHFMANVPWVYLDQINGKRIIEKRESDHGYTVGMIGVNDGVFRFNDLDETFYLIRRYVENKKE